MVEVRSCKASDAVRFRTGAPYISTFELKPHRVHKARAPRLASVLIYGCESPFTRVDDSGNHIYFNKETNVLQTYRIGYQG